MERGRGICTCGFAASQWLRSRSRTRDRISTSSAKARLSVSRSSGVSRGVVRLATAEAVWQGGGHVDDARPVPRLPLPGRDHRPRGVALPLLRPEPARGRDDPGRTWRGGEPRENPRLGPALRSRLRRRAREAPAAPGRQVAPGRGLHPDRGQLHYLWPAVDQHGTVLDVLVQGRPSAKAAERFFRKLLKGLRYVPRVIV